MSRLNGHNGHHPADVPAEERDWIGEATKMCAKPRKTLLLPEYGHVEALLAKNAELTNIVALQNRALITCLLQFGQPGFIVPASTIQKIEHEQLDLAIQRPQIGGPIHVNLLRPAPAPQQKK